MKIRTAFFIIWLCIIGFYTHVYARVILTGDSDAPTGETFSFAVLPNALTSKNGLYVGRLTTAGTVNPAIDQYSVTFVPEGFTNFRPLTPEKIYLNGVQNVDNPLIGQAISSIGLYRDAPLLVRGDAPQHVYWIASGSRIVDIEVLSAENIKDANGDITSGILKTIGGSYIFAATKPNGGAFGASNSGIALIQRNQSLLEQVAAVSGNGTVKAVPIDVSSSFLKITSDLASIDSAIFDMYWDDTLERLYVGVKATGDSGATDGARALFVGYLTAEDNGSGVYIPKLTFLPFAPADAFAGTNYIVGGVGSSVVAEIQKVRVMHTSTGVSYLITLGNAAADSNVQRTVSALPLVNKRVSVASTDTSWKADVTHGTLASKTIASGTNLQTYYTRHGDSYFFRGRGFQIPATAQAQLTDQSDTAAQVGGLVAPANVVDMQVYKDTIFVSCLTNEDQVRVYASQALFDGNGAIQAWTPWQAVMRSSTGDNQIYGIGYQGTVGRLYTLEGPSVTAAKRVAISTWSNGAQDGLLGGATSDAAVGFESLLKNSFSQENSGLQGLSDIPRQTTAFSQTAGRRCSWMIATGYGKLVIVETGQDNASNDFVPHVGNFDHADNIVSINGAIATAATSNTKMITVSGGALTSIGTITSIALANDATNGGYLVVGGVGGCAILRDSSGDGWAAGDMRKNFSTLGTNKSFVTIGSYTNIRKIIADGEYLYILTNQKFDRLLVSQLNGTPIAITLATPADLGLTTFESFSDVIVSNKLALLATSAGLYRTGNGKNTQTEVNASAMAWTRIALAQSPREVTRLYGLSTTSFEYDVAQQTGGGNVYVLAASVSDQNASVHRFSVSNIASTAISDTTVVELPDIQVQGITGPFAQLGAYRNFFATNGALTTVSRSSYNGAQSVLQSFPTKMTAGSCLNTRYLNTIAVSEVQTLLRNRVCNSALGSLLVPTNNGLQILE